LESERVQSETVVSLDTAAVPTTAQAPAAKAAAAQPTETASPEAGRVTDTEVGFDEVALAEALVNAVDLNMASRDILRLCASQTDDLTLAANFRNMGGQRQRQAHELLQYVPDALGGAGVEAEDGRFVQIRIELLDGEDPAAISDVISVLMRTEARFATLCQHAIQVAGTHGIASVLGRHLRNAQTLVSRINGLRPKVEA
jgi:hypothetical protein